jgi:hypothetical protein
MAGPQILQCEFLRSRIVPKELPTGADSTFDTQEDFGLNLFEKSLTGQWVISVEEAFGMLSENMAG